jgi:hypothetical protein
VPTSDEARAQAQRHAVEVPTNIEAAIVAVLVRPPLLGESHRSTGDQRELELREIVSQLSAAQSLALERRLDMDRDTDPLAVAFRRLLDVRRVRLRAFLADCRRKLAHAGTLVRASADRPSDTSSDREDLRMTASAPERPERPGDPSSNARTRTANNAMPDAQIEWSICELRGRRAEEEDPSLACRITHARSPLSAERALQPNAALPEVYDHGAERA